MDFENAVKALEQLKKVARSTWKNEGMYLSLVRGRAYLRHPTAGSSPNVRGVLCFATRADLFTANGLKKENWTPAPEDQLADDWEIVQ